MSDKELDQLHARLKAEQEIEADLSSMALSQLIIRVALVGSDFNEMEHQERTTDPDLDLLHRQVTAIIESQSQRLQALMAEIDRRFPVEQK